MIPGLPTVGPFEVLILLAIVLLFFGAKRIPELGKSLGKGLREFKEGTKDNLDPKEEDDTRELGESKDLPRKDKVEGEKAKESAPLTKTHAQTEQKSTEA
jgi:sec-independent protein translocase protein TatA